MKNRESLDGRETYLVDSMQFLLEYGCRFFNDGCWYIMPTFRGEDVDKRHLKQFFHSEAEIPGALTDVMSLVDEYIKHLLQKIQIITGEQKHLTQVIKHDIPRITFDEAEKILGKENIERHETWRNLSSNNEKNLLSILVAQCGLCTTMIKVKSSQPIQTAGFGMGIERFLLFVSGKNDIRDIQVFRRFNDGEDIV